MTTQTLDRHAVLDLYEQKTPERYAPVMHHEPRSVWATPEPQHSLPEDVTDPAIELAVKYFSEIRETDSDERLDYILAANPSVTEEHLGQLVLTTESWLDTGARERIRAIAREFVRRQREPHEVLPYWLTEEEFERFDSALDKTEFPDQIIATCYAVCQAHEVAHAAYFIQQDRMFPQVDFTKIEQTPEGIEADLRFVNAK